MEDVLHFSDRECIEEFHIPGPVKEFRHIHHLQKQDCELQLSKRYPVLSQKGRKLRSTHTSSCESLSAGLRT